MRTKEARPNLRRPALAAPNASAHYAGSTEAPLVLKMGKLLSNSAVYALLVIVAVVVLFPIAWMVLTSFKTESEVQAFPPTLLPHKWTLDPYRHVLQLYPFARFLLNSVIISVAVTVGTLISCSLAAFALVHLRFRGREFLFLVILGTLVIPFAATMVPIFFEMSKIHWINTWYPLIVPAFLGNAYGIFLLRQLFRSIPQELGEAATLDGCGPFGVLRYIYVPLSTSAFTALGVVTFINMWNNMIAPLVFVNDQSKMPVAVGLAYLNGQGSAIWSWLMAASTMSVVPLLLMYTLGQRYVVTGMTLAGADK
jgi:multiple sugar transport system permease protein